MYCMLFFSVSNATGISRVDFQMRSGATPYKEQYTLMWSTLKHVNEF